MNRGPSVLSLGRRQIAESFLILFAITGFALQAPTFLAHGVEMPSAIPRINPVELRIPSLRLRATVQQVGLTDDGSMDVPTNFSDVAWYSLGFRPGDFGSAVFDGHVSSEDAEAIFFYVEDLQPGALIHITGDSGTVLSFRVASVESYPYDQAPLGRIFGDSDWPQIVLITCGGTWNANDHIFERRTVVFATLIDVAAS